MPETSAGASERAGFIEAREIGPPNIASNAIVPPIADSLVFADRVPGGGIPSGSAPEGGSQLAIAASATRSQGRGLNQT